jgi:serine/threonine protein kinase
MAPEIIEKKSYYPDRIDIFSAGVALFTMYTGLPPYLERADLKDPYYELFVNDN